MRSGNVASARILSRIPSLMAPSAPMSATGTRSSPRTPATPSPRSPATSRPVLLFDVMDTLVADPFFTHMAAYFGMTHAELLAAKHPSAWVEFETGTISQDALFAKFFADGRTFDGPGLLDHMTDAYDWVPGMPELIDRLAGAGYELHAFSNYPEWWQRIEEKLKLGDRGLAWTFVSCTGPMRGLRKPAPAAYDAAIAHLGRDPAELLFVDDRQVNVDAAMAAGMQAVRFQGATALEEELRRRGLQF